jgi:ATP-dependent DNA ligase
VTVYGQVGGKLQTTSDKISEGKNLGRSNETSPLAQAESEAKSRWEKQLKSKKYVQSAEAAAEGGVDERVLGGVDVMLAHTFEKQGHKIKYPCYGQPKLDGTRCIAIMDGGKATLWSRTRKPITSMPHIVAALEKAYPYGRYVLDGELYAAHLNEDFETIVHFVRQQTAAEGHEVIEYWVYDTIAGPDAPFALRNVYLEEEFPRRNMPSCIKLVPTTYLKSEDAAMEYFAECQRAGFEGAMLRNSDGLYVHKRSYDLIKVKSFQDAEFPIVGVEEGRGKLMGSVGAFICKTESGATFKAKLMGSLDNLRTLYENPSMWQGKMLTVKYQNLTADGQPRFPVGKSIRAEGL